MNDRLEWCCGTGAQDDVTDPLQLGHKSAGRRRRSLHCVAGEGLSHVGNVGFGYWPCFVAVDILILLELFRGGQGGDPL